MEIIAAIIIYTIAEDIKENKATMVDLQEQIVELNDDFLKLAGAHSGLAAQHKLDHDTHHEKIDGIMSVLDEFAKN